MRPAAVRAPPPTVLPTVPLTVLLTVLLAALPAALPAARDALGASPGVPIVIGHRGASGLLPEHTLAAYELAIGQGADYIEPDLVISKDGVLFARHENEISGTTDVARKFPGRRTSKQVDGRVVFGWFLEDFTAAEVKTLRARERLSFRDQSRNGLYGVPPLREIIALVRRKSGQTGRRIGIYPETKHSTYFRSIGLPLETPLVKLLRANGYDRPDAPVFIQSFEVGNLKALKRRIRTPLMQLLGKPRRRPFDFVAAGDPRTYRDLATPEGLAEIARYARGIGASKQWLLSAHAAARGDVPGGARGDGPGGARGGLVERAHRAGLLVHAYTFRNEPRYIAIGAKADPAQEYLHFFRMGVDGVFSDFPATAVAARAEFLAGR